jgi:hypothetical protein
MTKQLAQLSDAYRQGAPLGGLSEWRAPTGGASGHRTGASGGGGRLLLVLGLIVAVVVGAIVAAQTLSGRAGIGKQPLANPSRFASPIPVASGSPGPARVDGVNLPPPGVGEAPERLLPVVAPPPGSGGYQFESPGADGGPVTYDPCRAIHYVVREKNAPRDGDAIVQQAIAAVSAATGLEFVADGPTDEGPNSKREAFQPQRYGQRWAPVLITWSDSREAPILAGSVLGYGGSSALTLTSGGSSEEGYVTGSVTLDAPDLRRTEARAGPAAVRGVVEHELGHVVGLGHVEDRTQLMYPETKLTVSQYQAGDRRGLAILGNGPCTPQL